MSLSERRNHRDHPVDINVGVQAHVDAPRWCDHVVVCIADLVLRPASHAQGLA